MEIDDYLVTHLGKSKFQVKMENGELKMLAQIYVI